MRVSRRLTTNKVALFKIKTIQDDNKTSFRKYNFSF